MPGKDPEQINSSYNETAKAVPLPVIKKWLVDGFYWFCQGYLKKHFHTLAMDRRELLSNPIPDSMALICYANHPGWWDPIIALHVCRTCFPRRSLYAPIDAAALARYRVFANMGFYGIDLSSRQGATNFLKTSQAILKTPNSSIWITPEGRFTDVRDRTARLMPGLAHLASRSTNLAILPLAIEYIFWEERLPECLKRLGKPIFVDEHSSLDKVGWAELLENRLRETQDQLTESSIQRRTSDFEIGLRGSSGSWRVYDWARRTSARMRGQTIDLQHGSKFRE